MDESKCWSFTGRARAAQKQSPSIYPHPAGVACLRIPYSRWLSSNRLGTVSASLGCQWNLAQAFRAGLEGGGGLGRGLLQLCHQRIQRQHDGKVNHAGYDKKRDGGVDEIADKDRRAI